MNTAVIYAFTAVRSVGFHGWSVRAGFADIRKGLNKMKIILKVIDLKKVFKFCKNFVASNTIKPIQTLVHLECENGICKACAIDGYKACIKNVSCEGDNGVMNIPIINLPKIPDENEVSISDDGKYITFDFQSEKRMFRKIEGEFLNIEKFFPTRETVFRISFEPKLLIKALKSYENERHIDMEFFGELNALKIIGADSKSLVLPIRRTKESEQE